MDQRERISDAGGRPRCLPCAAGIAAALLTFGLLITACSGSPAGRRPPDSLGQALIYARCMRAHGVPTFTDPVQGANGQVSQNLGNQNSPQVRSAEQACTSVAPGGSTGAPPLTAAQQHAYLRWAACMRAHGVPDFPDPTFPGGQVQINVPADARTNGTLQSAVPACARGIPGGSPIEFGPRT